jgi:hypothetical protein
MAAMLAAHHGVGVLVELVWADVLLVDHDAHSGGEGIPLRSASCMTIIIYRA